MSKAPSTGADLYPVPCEKHCTTKEQPPATMPRLTRKGWSCAVVLASLLLGCSGELSHHPLWKTSVYGAMLLHCSMCWRVYPCRAVSVWETGSLAGMSSVELRALPVFVWWEAARQPA